MASPWLVVVQVGQGEGGVLSGAGRFGPDRKFIAAGLDKVETAATGKIEQGAHYGAPCAGYLALGRLDIGAVEHQERPALSTLAAQFGER